jgi:hypothetical protein
MAQSFFFSLQWCDLNKRMSDHAFVDDLQESVAPMNDV